MPTALLWGRHAVVDLQSALLQSIQSLPARVQDMPGKGARFVPPHAEAFLALMVLALLPPGVEACGSLAGGWGVSFSLGYMFAYDVDT
jgi:hypothetical protein